MSGENYDNLFSTRRDCSSGQAGVTYRPDSMPVDANIVYHRIELGIDPVVLRFRKDDVATTTALFESTKDVAHVTLVSTVGRHNTLSPPSIVPDAHATSTATGRQKGQ